MKRYFILFLIVIGASACFYDKKSELYPSSVLNNACDTTSAMSFTKNIAPILNGYCTSCHSISSPTAGVVLDNYNSVSGVAFNGQLLGVIKHIPPNNLMPPSAPLDQCKIRQIELWVNAGAANN